MTNLALDLDHHVREHATLGLTVLRAAIPGDLVAEMRVAAEAIRAITRAECGPTATRPPGGLIGGRIIADFCDRVDTTAFEAFEELPVLRAFTAAALGPDFTSDRNAFTMLLQAEDREIVQAWHRDYRDNVPWLDTERWWSVIGDVRYFNQFNAALYHDISLWVVPGSHDRDDTDAEHAVVVREAAAPPDAPGDSPVYSQAADAYIRAMPGAHQVRLAPGDIAVYRDSALHLGHYLPTVRRATLHGHLDDPETLTFFIDHFRDRWRS